MTSYETQEFELKSANFNINPTRHHINEKSAAFIRARHLFEGGVYLSKMGKLGSVPVLRTPRLECLGMSRFLFDSRITISRENTKI